MKYTLIYLDLNGTRRIKYFTTKQELSEFVDSSSDIQNEYCTYVETRKKISIYKLRIHIKESNPDFPYWLLIDDENRTYTELDSEDLLYEIIERCFHGFSFKIYSPMSVELLHKV